MTETTAEPGERIVGREAELTALDEFVRSVGSPRAFVLTGGPGIGKTTLWEAGVDLARRRGLRVLSARASQAETQLAFAALTDLLDGVGPEELASVPPPQLHALEVALLRTQPPDNPPPPAALSVGFLNAVRALAAREPLLVALDDIQWLDAASAEAVAFAASRIDGQPVRFLLARRSRSASPLERAQGPNGVRRLEVNPLSLGATQRLLSERLGLRLPRHVLRRVVQSSLGNPLFALELGRTLAERAPPEIGEDVPLPETVEELLGTRVAALPRPVRRLVLAVALSGDLRTWQVAHLAPPGALDDAVDLGVLVVETDRVRPAHPLFATAAKSGARVNEQRELHLALAQVAGDEESRAVHLALAAERPDGELARAVAAAAAGAAARGARQDAVVLAEHALRLTPAPAERTERVLALGGYLEAAGEAQRITDLVSPELDSLPRGAPRVRALLLLMNGVVSDNDEIRRYLDEALSESGTDEVLRASVLLEIAENEAGIRVQQIPTAEAWALEALQGARAGGGDLERRALYALAWPRALRGQQLDDLCERFRAASDARYSAISTPEAPGSSTARNGVSPLSSGAIRCVSRAADRLANGTSASRTASSASAQVAAWKPPWCSARPPANSGFSAPALISIASTSSRPDQRIVERAGDRRHAAQPERVLQPRGRRRVGGQHAHPRPRRGQPGSGRAAATAASNAWRLPRSAWNVSAATPNPASSRSARSAPGEHRRGERGGVGGHERQRVARLDVEPVRQLRRVARVGLPRQRQRELREHGEVAGADAAELAQPRQRALAQHRRQRVGHRRAVAARARGHLREAHEQRRAHDLLGQRVAEPRGVAAQQPHACAPGGRPRHLDVAQWPRRRS